MSFFKGQAKYKNISYLKLEIFIILLEDKY